MRGKSNKKSKREREREGTGTPFIFLLKTMMLTRQIRVRVKYKMYNPGRYFLSFIIIVLFKISFSYPTFLLRNGISSKAIFLKPD